MDLLRFLPIAEAVAGLSKDPAVKIGALVIDDDANVLSKDPAVKIGALVIDDDANVLSLGFNGFPRGVHDADHRLRNRKLKLCFVVHAEANAIAQAARTGVKTIGANLIVTERYPCATCAGLIIQAGIKRVYAPVMSSEDANQQWFEEKEFSEKMFHEAGVEVIEYLNPAKMPQQA